MSDIDCLRHGETIGGNRYHGSTDVALSAQGLEQMRFATAQRSWDCIISSPLQRCASFAGELARRLSIPCQHDPDLREMHFGDWEGLSPTELMHHHSEALGRFWTDPIGAAPPHSEPLIEVQQRVLAAWTRIVSNRLRHGDTGPSRTLIITHGGPIRILLAARRGLPLSDVLSIEVPYAALITIDSDLVDTMDAHLASRASGSSMLPER